MRLLPTRLFRSSLKTSEHQRRENLNSRLLFETLEDRRLLTNLRAVDAWLVDTQTQGRIAAPMIGETIAPMANWTVTGASGAINYDVEYSIDGVSVYRGNTIFNNGNWLWYRGATYATAGTHTLRITIDPFNTVVETNETDNSFSMQFTTANVSTLVNKLDWPLAGVQGKDWTIINYLDVDPRPNQRADYMGGAFQYDGHDGIDISLANFETMDSGVPILAAANGRVTQVGDGNFDRNQVAANQTWNYIQVDHGNGWSTIYGHAMQNSISVKVGDVVSAGDILGYVGSSGNSTGAHLHFTVLHGELPVETNLAPTQYWNSPLPYMGSIHGDILSSDITNYDPFSVPTTDTAEGISEQPVFSSTGSQTVRFVFNSSHLLVGESWVGKVYSPTNVLLNTIGPFGGWTEPVRGGSWWFSASRTWPTGRYRAAVEINGVERQSEFFDVIAVAPPQLRVDLSNAIILDGRTTPIDIGTVALNAASPSTTFQLWNHGGSVLSITSISANGGFSVLNAPTTLQPGEKKTFQVTMPTGSVGTQFGEIRITSNDPDNSLYSFNVKGVVTGSSAPSTVVLSTGATPYSVQNIPYLLDGNVTVTSSSLTFGGAVLSIDLRSGADATDKLIIVPQGDGTGQVNLTGNTIKYAGASVADYTGGFDGTQLRITFNASASLPVVNAVAKRIAFQSSRLTSAPRYLAYTFQEQAASVSPLVMKMVVQGRQAAATPSFVVTNINDAGPGSLRQAILDANSNPGRDLIQFAIAGASRTISPTTALPEITDAVIVDAMTQPGFLGSPIVELNGSLAGNNNGLKISAGGSTVRGLVIRNFTNYGILLSVGDNNIIEGNYVGTNLAGSTAQGNGNGIGIELGSAGNRIGSDGNGANDSSERNLISGNRGSGLVIVGAASNDNIVRGNFIGTNATGTLAVANVADGIYLETASRTLINGNTISGNGRLGIYVRGALFTGGVGGTGTVVSGNRIGTNANATAAIGNVSRGIQVDAGSVGTLIGTDGDGVNDVLERNIISGNSAEGIAVGVRGTDDTIVRGNYIGTDVTGELDLGNAGSGVVLWEWFYSATSEGSPKRAVVRDNLISGNNGLGIHIAGPGSDSHRIFGNKIGTNVGGTIAVANAGGVLVSSGAKSNLVGTNSDGVNDAAELNLISGNADYGVYITDSGTNGNVVAGNWIGLAANGTSALANRGNAGVVVGNAAANNRIGTLGDGTSDVEERNVISGNTQEGIQIEGGATGTAIAGNYLGTNAAGTAAVPNGFSGILVWGAAKNTRVGTDANGIGDTAERNVISGNTLNGLSVRGTGTDGTIAAGNFIGTNAAGTAAVKNNEVGVYVSGINGLVIGTNGDGVGDLIEGNLVSGNGWDGIRFNDTSTNAVVAGNQVGTNFIGSAAIPNGFSGVAVHAGNINIRIGTNADGVSDQAERNTISGNQNEGVFVAGATTNGVVVAGNYIGTDINGTSALGNGLVGVNINAGAKNTRVGTNGDGVRDDIERNVISANGNDGVLIRDANTNGTVIAGNFVGTDKTGTLDLGNIFSGVAVWGGPANTRIGTDNSNDAFNANERNLVSGNNSWGVYVSDSTTKDTLISGNYVGVNVSGNAKLPNSTDGLYVNATVNTTVQSNLVSGNDRHGMYIRGGLFSGGAGGTGTVVIGNLVGTDATGTAKLGNSGRGIQIDAGSIGTRIGTDADGVNDSLERNIISGNGNEGVAVGVRGTDDSVIRGNYIGTDVSGTIDLGNGGTGITLAEWFYTATSEGSPKRAVVQNNVISGNSVGIFINGTGSNSHSIQGNKIGTNAAGTAAIGNGGGILISNAANNNLIGTNADGVNDISERNIISGNRNYGVNIGGSAVDGTIIAGNFIGASADGLIAVPNLGSAAISVGATATNVRVGGSSVSAGNLIAFNTGAGLRMPQTPLTSQVVRFNQFHHNAIGIDLGTAGPTLNDAGDTDGVRNAPVFTKSHILNGSLVVEGFARPGAEFDVFLTGNYAGGQGQGERYLTTFIEGGLLDQDATVDSYGPLVNGRSIGLDTTNRFKFSVPLASLPVPIAVGNLITAHAVAATSEFSFDSSVVVEPRVDRIQINDGANSRSQVTSLTIDFNTSLDLAKLAEAFVLTNIDTGVVVGNVNVAGTTANGKTSALLTFAGASTVARAGVGLLGNSLANGNYRLDVLANKTLAIDTAAAMNADYIFGGQTASAQNNDRFFRLLGDANGDGVLNGIDLNAIIPSLFNPLGYRADLDTNGDGVINGIDLNALIPTLFGQGRR